MGNRRKTWAPHLKDYNSDADDLLWGPNRDKGKALLGAVNYLSGKGMNVFSFLTFNVAGDDENVFMHIVKKDLADYEANQGKKTPDKAWTTSIERLRMDVSKTAQWDRVMQYADRKGMFLHFKTSEAENCKLMDGGDLGPERRLYFRELVARFGYHLALNWNFGEENSQTTEQHQAQMAYVKRIDPYNHLRVVHTFPGAKDKVYGPLLGDKSDLTGLSLQTSNPAFTQVYGDVKKWVLLSEASGQAVGGGLRRAGRRDARADHRRRRPGPRQRSHQRPVGYVHGRRLRHRVVLRLQASRTPILTCEDWRSRDKFWDQGKIALRLLLRERRPVLEDAADADEVGRLGAGRRRLRRGLRQERRQDRARPAGSRVHRFANAPQNRRIGIVRQDPGQGRDGAERSRQGRRRLPAQDRPEGLEVQPGERWKPRSRSLEKPAIPAFAFNYDPTNAKKVHKQSGGIVVVEAEDFDAVDREDARKWCLTTVDKTPGIQPDPDPNHAAGAVGGAYLELLPDTRVTHGDPLVHGVSFTNTPGQCSVLYYPVIFTEPGRYYVWVRMCCTGSEDNGLHVGLDGEWPASGARLQFTGKHGQWQWDSRQRTNKVHTGVLGQIWLDVDKPGLHTIMFSMREDGFEFDRFMLTKQQNAMESKNSEPGPAASVQK